MKIYIVQAQGLCDDSPWIVRVCSSLGKAEAWVRRRGRIVRDFHGDAHHRYATLDVYRGRGRRNLAHNREEVLYSVSEHEVDPKPR